LGLPREFPRIDPEAVKGIEINPYAAELARVTVWIGEIQWMRRNGFDVGRNPILNPDGSEAAWPEDDVIIGNPPFLGDKAMRDRLGPENTLALRGTFAGRVPGGADLICYWFEKARAIVEALEASRVGLAATNAIRRGANRVALDRISETADFFSA
jgi:type II restriction/modification system DNA methylase subunit YeeA